MILRTLLLLLGTIAVLAACRSGGQPRPSARPADVKTLPDDLSQHLRAAGIELRRDLRYSGAVTEWVVVDPESDGRCEWRTRFLAFEADVPLAAIRDYLMGISAPAELNQPARLAMFRPWGRGTTSEPDGCKQYLTSAVPKAERLLAAFRSYAPQE